MGTVCCQADKEGYRHNVGHTQKHQKKIYKSLIFHYDKSISLDLLMHKGTRKTNFPGSNIYGSTYVALLNQGSMRHG